MPLKDGRYPAPISLGVKAVSLGSRSTLISCVKQSAFAGRSPKGHQRSLRDVATELAKLGFVNERGAVFSPSSVQSMLV
jgi:hypothetical protein